MDINEKKVMIKGEFNIAATVTCGDDSKRSPAVVLIMGTGKLDRDGNGFGFRSNIYKELAEYLSSLGFVTARYDKRGTHLSGGSFKKTGLNDLVNDAVSVVRYLKKLPYVDEDRIIICGHSEGAIIATLLAEKIPTAGLILLGGAGMCLKDAMYNQNKLAAKEIEGMKGLKGSIMGRSFSLDKQLAMLDEMFEKSKTADKDTLFFKGAMMPAKWLREHAAYTSEDYAEKLVNYGKPVLAITGKADVQADHHYLESLSGNKNIKCCAPEKLTHMLRKTEGNIGILDVKKEYAKLIRQPIDNELKTLIADWLKEYVVTRQ